MKDVTTNKNLQKKCKTEIKKNMTDINLSFEMNLSLFSIIAES